jgi:type IV pilus assembly protein PilY1
MTHLKRNYFAGTAKKLWAFAAIVCAAHLPLTAQAFTPLQNPPATVGAPGNLLLALSVEFPTGLQVSYTGATYAFNAAVPYQGYFDSSKCYTYSIPSEVFTPVSARSATGSCPANTQWSGDVLNWLTMTNVDQFRSAMTGGTRDNFSSMAATSPGDTTAATILIRSFSDRNSYNPVKTLPNNASGTPTAFAGFRVRSGGYGSKFLARNDTTFTDMTAGAQQLNSCANTTVSTNPTGSTCFNIRVAVCALAPLEGNCNAGYSGVAKPEGLVQQYATKMRFGAFGYLNETGNNRSGGVLRSALKSVGSTAVSATTTIANAAKEWNEVTGIMVANPDPVDATASGVTQSGLMNYLNKFGFAAGYKGNDPVSELYYAAQLYLRGRALPAAYTDFSGATAAQISAYKDGFPVITGSDLLRGGARDPIIQSCQKNFILGLGDIYTHCDGNLPGSTSSSACVGGAPSDPDGLNVATLWNNVTALEGSTNWTGGSSNATPYMAGLAHWANTKDIRSDLAGTQTISTYWVDVLENTNGQSTVAAASLVKSQYWFAAKYGGFETKDGSGNAVTNPNSLKSSWDANNDGIPDTWFAGSTPTLLKQGLASAFSKIAAASTGGSAGGAAASAPLQTSDSQILYTGYNPQNWTGTVRSCGPTQNADQCSGTPIWEASRWFKTTSPTFVATPLTDTTRKIITSFKTIASFTTSAFEWGSLSSAQQAILNSTDSKGALRAAYLRGNRAEELTGLFRTRSDTLLGDIVNSGVRYLGQSESVYRGANFLDHAAYRTLNKARAPVAYVGANDGMLHAFDAANGKELFAYIPGSVFGNLPGLTALPFNHRYFVDSTPMVGDVQNGANWNTILVGGLGAGGKGYYALNITTQNAFAAASQASLASLPIWEFTDQQDADLGYTFNNPAIDPVSGANRQIAKIASASSATGEWRAIVGNGYGSANGKSVLFMLNALTGTVGEKLQAATGPNNGLSTPIPVDVNRDGLVDTIYAGDLSGKMHKFQFSVDEGGKYVLAKSGNSLALWRYIGVVLDSGKPITTAPSAVLSCDNLNYIVAFGTGKLNESSDYQGTAGEAFYAVVDSKPSTALTVATADLAEITLTTTVSAGTTVRNWPAPDMTGKKGWYMPFTGGERVLSNSTLPIDTGGVLIGTTKPSGEVCSPGNIGFDMLVDLCTGKPTGLFINGVSYGGVGTGALGDGINILSNTITNQDNKQVVIGNKPTTCIGPTCITCTGPLCTCATPPCDDGKPNALKQTIPKGRYSWREILTK